MSTQDCTLNITNLIVLAVSLVGFILSEVLGLLPNSKSKAVLGVLANALKQIPQFASQTAQQLPPPPPPLPSPRSFIGTGSVSQEERLNFPFPDIRSLSVEDLRLPSDSERQSRKTQNHGGPVTTRGGTHITITQQFADRQSGGGIGNRDVGGARCDNRHECELCRQEKEGDGRGQGQKAGSDGS